MSIYDQLGCTSKLSPEAIKNYSGNMHPFAKELIEICSRFKLSRTEMTGTMGRGSPENKVFATSIISACKKHLNLHISNYYIEWGTHVDAFAYIPDLNKENPMFSHIKDSYSNYNTRQLLESRDAVKGWCDNDKVKLGGDFSKVPCSMGISIGAINLLEPGEIASIIAHEIGHIWSTFEFISLGVFRNVYLLAACQDAKKEWASVNKSTIVKSIFGDDATGKFDGINIVTKNDLDKVLCEVITYNIKEASDLTKNSYDNTMSESYADQFAARLGLGAYGITGMVKAGILYEDLSNNRAALMILAVLKIIGGVIILLVSALHFAIFIPYLIIVCLSNYADIMLDQNMMYDSTHDRMIRIRANLIAALKETEDKDTKKRLLNDLDITGDLIREYTDIERASLYKEALKVVVPYFRNNINKKQLQQSYERLINNELYVVGNKFNNLRA